MKADFGMDYVHVEIDGGSIAVVRVEDPNDEKFVERRHPMHRELRDIWVRLAEDDSVGAVVYAGGRDHFFPAPRLPQLAALFAAWPQHVEAINIEAKQIFVNMVEFPKPLIVAAYGPVIGMGPQIAFLADFVVASRDTTFTDSHVPLGLTSGDGATVVWPLVIGLSRARRHILRGAPLSAVEAEELGLVSTLVDSREELVPAALALATELLALPQLAYRTTKIALNQWLKLGVQISLEAASAFETTTFEAEHFRALLAKYSQPAEGQ